MKDKIKLNCKKTLEVVHSKKTLRVFNGLLSESSDHYRNKVLKVFGALKRKDELHSDQFPTLFQFLNNPDLEEQYNDYVPTRVDVEDINNSVINFNDVKTAIQDMLVNNDLTTTLRETKSGEKYESPDGNTYMCVIEKIGKRQTRRRQLKVLETKNNLDICTQLNGGKTVIYDRISNKIVFNSRQVCSILDYNELPDNYTVISISKKQILLIDKFGKQFIFNKDINILSKKNKTSKEKTIYIVDKNNNTITPLGFHENIPLDELKIIEDNRGFIYVSKNFIEVIGEYIYMSNGNGECLLYNVFEDRYEDININHDLSQYSTDKGFFFSQNCNTLFFVNENGGFSYDRRKLPQEIEMDLYESRGEEPPLSIEEEIQEIHERDL